MKKIRISAALTALMMASSVFSTVNAEETGDSVSKIKELIAYLQNLSENSYEAYSYDINCDNSVNILDLIYSKGTVSENLKIDTENKSVNYMNSAASTLFNVAMNTAHELETAGKELSSSIYSSEDLKKLESLNDSDQQMLKKINSSAEYNKITKWAVSVKDYCVLSCVTGDDIIQRTGAYPNTIPQKYNIPYSNELVKQAASCVYNWETDFNGFTSINPVQASLPDFPLSMRLKIKNQIAKTLFTDLQTAAQELETEGVCVNGIINWDDDNELIELLKRKIPSDSLYWSYIYSKEDGVYASNKLKWTSQIKDNIVCGVIVEDAKYNCTGAYPNLIPYSMNVPYSPDLIEYVCDIKKDWETDYPQYITENEEQLALAEEYSEDSGDEDVYLSISWVDKASINSFNSNSNYLFASATSVVLDCMMSGYDVPDGITSSDDNSEFSQMIREAFSVTADNSHWAVYVSDGEVKGAVYSAGNKKYTGAFPNMVPNDCIVSYDHELAIKAADDNAKWGK